MDISRDQQRVLHALAKGGCLTLKKSGSGRILDVELITREGWRMPDISIRTIRKLKRLKAIASSQGGPYRVTRRGLELVRSQLDNR